MENPTFLLPLSEVEAATLTAAVTLVLTSIDTTAYASELQRQVAMAQKPPLESIRNKLTQRR